MILRDVHSIFENWAPRGIAWERDNVGLQVGSMNQRVQRILVSLDVTDEIVAEARRIRADLIISHHPLLFHPAKVVDTDERVGRILAQLLRRKIALYAAHTNLDFTRDGVSFTLAERLGLQGVNFLHKDQRVQQKIIVYVPAEYVEHVTAAMAAAGAGRIGNYELCSFRINGLGTFKALKNAKPFIGKAIRQETVQEVRLEMVLPRWKLSDVVRAMRSAHPYEEAAYDVYDVASPTNEYGAGAIGTLKRSVSINKFLGYVARTLHVSALRYSSARKRTVKHVAVCGGSGSSLLDSAIKQGADAFVTADVTYHTFQECDRRILLVDAGHFETEQPVVPRIVEYLRTRCKIMKMNVDIFPSRQMPNFVQYYTL
jgi:dinuclear metal center YbgI/SA1388 family protein